MPDTLSSDRILPPRRTLENLGPGEHAFIPIHSLIVQLDCTIKILRTTPLSDTDKGIERLVPIGWDDEGKLWIDIGKHLDYKFRQVETKGAQILMDSISDSFLTVDCIWYKTMYHDGVPPETHEPQISPPADRN